MKRIMIVGQPGGGKSTLARILGAKLNLPVVHVDMIHWMPGWQERSRDEKIRLARIEEEKDAWVFEGSLSATHDTRLDRAEMLIVLNIRFSLRVWRVFWRTIKDYGRSRADLPEDCPERFSREFWMWIWKTRKTQAVYNQGLAQRARRMGKPVFVLSSPRAVRDFVQQVEQGLDWNAVSGQ